MSAIDMAMRKIATIPSEVLKQAFSPKRYDPTRSSFFYDNVTPLSIEACIRDKVINERVMLDLGSRAGKEVYLPMNLAEVDRADLYNVVYHFDDSATNGCTIISPIEMSYSRAAMHSQGMNTSYGFQTSQSSQFFKATRDVINAAAGTPALSTPNVQLIGHNTVLISDMSPIQHFGVLRCLVSYGSELVELRPQYWHHFADLCFYAARSYIYSRLVIDLDEGQLRGGQQIGRFREIVDSFADAEEMYSDKLRKFAKLSIMNDPQQMRKVTKLALGARPKF